jgi:5-formyltetrahydrofolate cyclo-ligase
LLYAQGVARPPNDVLEEKRALRERMKAWRAALPPADALRDAEAVAAHGLEFLGPLTAGTVVSAFAPMPGEFRLWPLLRRLAREGVQLALPVMQGKAKALIFRAWAPGDATDSAVWGIAEPKPDKPVLEPDVLIVPLLAFDRDGWRLGYGGGFYDRTLRGLRARKSIVAVGVGYDGQQIEAVPHFDYDERLDWVLTPSGALRCGA